ncbi:ABC transporter ATP-binding protein [Bacillus cereus]|uniref:ABC transporter ATP-binding protein n=1 Tax=Bacillus cereus TaxID=1396 RepID=UPI0009BE7292|nr:ABC transporter ATP-binding protein [Bacillus cereus]
MKVILEAKQIKKVYGAQGNGFIALNDIDLMLREGEFVGIMRPSGAGKSTLLNVLSTIDHPTSGEVLIAGKQLCKMNEKEMAKFRREELGFIFQDYNLLHSLTVRENIALPLALAKTSAEEIEKRVTEVAQTFGIYGLLDKFPSEISGGQRQRTASSRAIVTKPSLIFADEPTGALDSKSAQDFLESLTHLNEVHTATIMMITHDAYAASFCKRILFINDGIVFEELKRARCTRKEFFQNILDMLAKNGGDTHDVI